jgi:hypothetical protein
MAQADASSASAFFSPDWYCYFGVAVPLLAGGVSGVVPGVVACGGVPGLVPGVMPGVGAALAGGVLSGAAPGVGVVAGLAGGVAAPLGEAAALSGVAVLSPALWQPPSRALSIAAARTAEVRVVKWLIVFPFLMVVERADGKHPPGTSVR